MQSSGTGKTGVSMIELGCIALILLCGPWLVSVLLTLVMIPVAGIICIIDKLRG